MRFEPFVGLRYLMAKRERNVLSIITLISVAGVAFGVTALIVVLSVMGGFEGDLRKKILGTKSHIVVSSDTGYLDDYEALTTRIEGVSGVVGASAYVEGEVMVTAGNLQGVVLQGILPEQIGKVSELEDNMKEGSLEDLNDPEGVVRKLFSVSGSDVDTRTSPDEQMKRSARSHASYIRRNEQMISKGLGKGRSPRSPTPQPPPGASIDPNDAPDVEEKRLPVDPDDDTTPSTPDPDDDAAPSNARPAPSTLGPAKTSSRRQMGAIPGLGGDGTDDKEPPKRKVGGLIVGAELKKNLTVWLGQEVTVMSPMGDIGPTGSIPKARPFRVVGVFYTGMYEYDTKYVYMTLKAAQDFLGIGDRVTGIEVKIADPDDPKTTRDAIASELADIPGIVVRDWRELNSNLFSALLLEKIAMFIILTFIILVASFSIVCLLIMIVIEKGREIAILKSMGASNRSIMQIFVIQGGVIGVLGTALGLAMGLGLTYWIANRGIQLDPDVYYISQLPVEVRTFEVALICTSAVVISLLATVYPSIQAARLDPVEGLRYE